MSSEQDSDQESVYDWKAYVVVRANVNDKEKYDVIPSSWIVHDEECGRGYQTSVNYLFPPYEKLGTGIKFKKTQKPNEDWPEYLGKMLLDTNSQAEAFRFMNQVKQRSRMFQIEMGDCDTTSESDSEEEDPPKRSGTKRKQPEQKNKRQKVQAKAKK